MDAGPAVEGARAASDHGPDCPCCEWIQHGEGGAAKRRNRLADHINEAHAELGIPAVELTPLGLTRCAYCPMVFGGAGAAHQMRYCQAEGAPRMTAGQYTTWAREGGKVVTSATHRMRAQDQRAATAAATASAGGQAGDATPGDAAVRGSGLDAGSVQSWGRTERGVLSGARAAAGTARMADEADSTGRLDAAFGSLQESSLDPGRGDGRGEADADAPHILSADEARRDGEDLRLHGTHAFVAAERARGLDAAPGDGGGGEAAAQQHAAHTRAAVDAEQQRTHAAAANAVVRVVDGIGRRHASAGAAPARAVRSDGYTLLRQYVAKEVPPGSITFHAAPLNMAHTLGPQDQVAMAPLMHQLAVDLSSHLDEEAPWSVCFVVSRLFLWAPADAGTSMVAAIRERLALLEDGRVRKLWTMARTATRLPTVSDWEKRQVETESARRERIGASVKAELRRGNVTGAVRGIADTPSASPSDAALDTLTALVNPWEEANPKVRMKHLYQQYGYDRPIAERCAEFLKRLHADKDWRDVLIKRWAPRFAATRLRKAASGTGARSEHRKPFYMRDLLQWAIIGEAVSAYVIPPGAARVLGTVLAQQLLKKDKEGRYSSLSKTRPIGKCERLLADMLSHASRRATKALGPYLSSTYNQNAIAIPSGGEIISTGIQLRCHASRHCVTAFSDVSNAFCSADNEDTAEALEALREEVKQSGWESATAMVEACDTALRDLVFWRTRDSDMVTVVNGVLRVIRLRGGEVQGGLYSMLRFAVLVAIKVIRAIHTNQRLSTRIVEKSIADDLACQLDVLTPDDLELLVEWLLEYGRLMTIHKLRTNFGKFVIMQHADRAGTELDVATILERLPRDALPPHHGPRVERLQHLMNGVPIGFCDVARAAGVVKQADVLAERSVILEALIPIAGRQEVELIGRMAYAPRAVMNHAARNVEPAVSLEGMQRAQEAQMRLLRAILCCSVAELPDAQFTVSGVPHSDTLTVESVHLPRSGLGWTNPVETRAIASAARVIDCLPRMRATADLSPLIPPAAEWETCDQPILRAAMATIRSVVGLRSFRHGPTHNREAWKYMVTRLLPGGAFAPDGIETLAGRHFQRVATAASMQDMYEALIEDDTLPAMSRARLRSCSHFCSGAWQRIGSIGTHTELSPHIFLHALRRRVGLPCTAITKDTRCTKPGCLHGPSMADPPTYVGVGAEYPTWVSLRAFREGVHWDHCIGAGMSVQGHNAISALVAAMFAKCGYSARVSEVNIGKGGPRRDGTNQRLDGTATSWTAGDGRTLAWDTTVGAALVEHRHRLREAARTTGRVTAFLEQKKKLLKAAAAQAAGYHYFCVALDSLGYMGVEATETLLGAFHAREDAARTDHERWVMVNERVGLFASVSAMVQRRSAMILLANARPLAGGFAAPAAIALHSGDPAELPDALG